MKRYVSSVLSLLLLLSLTGCGGDKEPPAAPEPEKPPAAVETPTAPETPEDSTIPEEPFMDSGDIVIAGDSYWVLEKAEGDMRQYGPESDDLLTDLTLWDDGTARIREIEDGIWLASDGREQNMAWTCAANGSISLYANSDDAEPLWTGSVSHNGMLELERFGGTYTFRQEPMPEGGNLYSPAELRGVWLQIGSEVEGDIDESLPHNFNSLVFRAERDGEEKRLLASADAVNYGIFDPNRSCVDCGLTVLDQPVYMGCGNDEWSVRIGEESPLNQHGYPSGVDTYVTLLDQNTLLRQQYYSFDNGEIPGVSYQTYKRFLPEADPEIEKADLTDRYFELDAYMGDDGMWYAEHPEYDTFDLYLNENGYHFHIAADDGSDYIGGGGCWEMGRGGTLYMTSEGSEDDWLAGAARNVDGTPEIYLWNAGSILRLKCTERDGDYGSDGEWGGYVDTMNDLEGRAFSAPENTLCILYNQNYTDLEALNSFPFYEIDDGAEAQYMLVTSTLDDAYFWLDEDGYCREEFGTVHAGESFVIRLNIPESGGYLLQIECSTGAYCFELTRSSMDFYEHWNYIVT